MNLKSLSVDGERLQTSIEESAKIGKTANNGLLRLAISDEDKIMRDLLVKWLKECGCEIVIDEIGNIFGIRRGLKPDLGAILSGSHLDTQNPDGKFNGILGTLGALEVLRTINDYDIKLERDLIIADWTNSEGAWFSPGCLGAGLWAGRHSLENAYNQRDRDGKTILGRELERTNYKGSFPASYTKWNIFAAYELHIEKTTFLKNNNKQIGIPTETTALRWYKVWLEGISNHAGSLPMSERKDPLLAFSKMNLTAYNVAMESDDILCTIGEVQAFPNSCNTTAESVQFKVDIRSFSETNALNFWETIKNEFSKIAKEYGCRIKTEESWELPKTSFSDNLRQIIFDTSKELGFSSAEFPLSSGYDMSEISRVTDGAMILVPSEDDDTTYKECEAGANVLLHSILKTGK
ncbi:MAG: hydantoinase/carbamoylase family amidase [Spirochaetales bacterium]|nr:hydantoinase/carbamoylase family amidase [Spirochaetales bacterium]